MLISAGSPTRSVRSHGELLIVGGRRSLDRLREGEPRAVRAPRGVRSQVLGRRGDHPPLVGAGSLALRPPASDRPLPPTFLTPWVTAGFMKWGFASATFAAMILVDRIAGSENPWADTFAPRASRCARRMSWPGWAPSTRSTSSATAFGPRRRFRPAAYPRRGARCTGRPRQEGHLPRRGGHAPRGLAALHPHGVPRPLQRRRALLGLPVPPLPLRRRRRRARGPCGRAARAARGVRACAARC
jgi:hypothetical protein